MAPYTYRIVVANRSRVQATKFNKQGELVDTPSGTFNLKSQNKKRVEELHGRLLKKESSLTAAEIEELGHKLFNALFDPALRTDFLNVYSHLGPQEQLRVELDFDSTLPDLAALPWEFLHPPMNAITGDLWLATAPQVVLSRYVTRWNPAPPIQLQAGEKLRIALVVSNPTHPENLGPVSYEKLQAELQTLADDNADRIELLPLVNPATGDTIDEMLEKSKPHLFHFIGHGQLAQDAQGRTVGQLALMNAVGHAIWINAANFGGLFNRHRPALVLLQACKSAAQSGSQAFTGVASQIVQQNIPVVVAMQYEITNNDARRFAREFYERLAAGAPVDQAAQEGRLTISDFNQRPDFATPVLFMRVLNGELFTHSPPIAVVGLDAELRKKLVANFNERFNLSELRGICFEMEIEDENFAPGKEAFVRDLIRYCEDRDRIDALIAIGKRERSFLDWGR